jgi:hypothetical protein
MDNVQLQKSFIIAAFARGIDETTKSEILRNLREVIGL